MWKVPKGYTVWQCTNYLKLWKAHFFWNVRVPGEAMCRGAFGRRESLEFCWGCLGVELRPDLSVFPGMKLLPEVPGLSGWPLETRESTHLESGSSCGPEVEIFVKKIF